MGTTFSQLPARLQAAIVARLGWTALRPVQEQAGAAILAGQNVVVLAPTAGGKTEAAVFPALAGLMTRAAAGVGMIYVAPLKALLNNQEERITGYAEMVGLRGFVWHGDVSAAARRGFLREPAEVLLTTPESLEVMLLSARVPSAELFADLQVVVVDEAHAFAGTDRGAHLMAVLERVALLARGDVQRVGLSATVGNPEQVLRWLQGSSRRAGAVVRPEGAKSKRQLLVLLREGEDGLASAAARLAAGKKSLLFCPSRALTESVAERMRGLGTEVFVHHSSIAVEERQAAEARFQQGASACIVCTSTLELGIDVGDLDQVLQVNAPSTVSSFLQRMGRTGRRGGLANSTFLCGSADAVLQVVALIELAREGFVEEVAAQTRCWPVLVHQLLALTLQHGALSAERCWGVVSVVPDFGGIGRGEFDGLVAHLLREGYLFEAGGLLSMGERAERVYGKKNFMELYAVFSSPAHYRVMMAGREVGSLEQGFVDGLVEGMSSFLLAGRAWLVERVQHSERVVTVREAPRGQRPTWGGYLPQVLGSAVAQRMRRVLEEEGEYGYLEPAAQRALTGRREELGPLLRGTRGVGVQLEEDCARCWTFAGGRINATLKYALEWLTGWRVVGDNLGLQIEGAGVTHGSVAEALGRLGEAGFWEDERTEQALLSRLPEYRLSKFQRALPAAAALEWVGGALLDLKGARGFMGGERMKMTTGEER